MIARAMTGEDATMLAIAIEDAAPMFDDALHRISTALWKIANKPKCEHCGDTKKIPETNPSGPSDFKPCPWCSVARELAEQKGASNLTCPHFVAVGASCGLCEREGLKYATASATEAGARDKSIYCPHGQQESYCQICDSTLATYLRAQIATLTAERDDLGHRLGLQAKECVELQDRVQKAEKERDYLRDVAIPDKQKCIDYWGDKNDRAESLAAKRLEDLKKYGAHQQLCGARFASQGYTCTCGLTQAIEGTESARSQMAPNGSAPTEAAPGVVETIVHTELPTELCDILANASKHLTRHEQRVIAQSAALIDSQHSQIKSLRDDLEAIRCNSEQNTLGTCCDLGEGVHTREQHLEVQIRWLNQMARISLGMEAAPRALSVSESGK